MVSYCRKYWALWGTLWPPSLEYPAPPRTIPSLSPVHTSYQCFFVLIYVSFAYLCINYHKEKNILTIVQPRGDHQQQPRDDQPELSKGQHDQEKEKVAVDLQLLTSLQLRHLCTHQILTLYHTYEYNYASALGTWSSVLEFQQLGCMIMYGRHFLLLLPLELH